MNCIAEFFIQTIGVQNLVLIYQWYLNVYNCIVSFIYLLFKPWQRSNGIEKITFVSEDLIINLRINCLQIDNLNSQIPSDQSGHIEITYRVDNNLYNMLVPWNVPSNDQDIQIVSETPLYIKTLEPVPILYACDDNNNDYTDLVSSHSGHLASYTLCPISVIDTEFGSNTIVLRDLSLKNIRPLLIKNKIEIMTEDGTTYDY